MKRILRGIQPFNEMQMKSCYHNQLVTGYSMYGVNKIIVIADSLPLYFYDEEKNELSIQCINVLSKEEMQQLTGVRRERYGNYKNIGEFIIGHIDRREPIILPVDSYFLNYRADRYHILHEAHFVLVYGYDTDEGVYYTVDHMYRNSFVYKKKAVPMKIIQTAYKGFATYLDKGDKKSITVLKKDGIPHGDFEELYRIRLKKMSAALNKSLDALTKFIAFFLGVVVIEKTFSVVQEHSLSVFGELQWYKLAQKNIFGFVFRNPEINKITERILENYIFLFNNVAKVKRVGILNEKNAIKMLDRAKELLNLERKLHCFLVEEL